MTSPERTDEAVEAAARAEFEHDTSGSTLWPLAGAWDEAVAWSRQVYAKRAAAGIAAAAPYVAAKALREAVDEMYRWPQGTAWRPTAATWLLRRADEIERAARAAGKDGTDG